VERENTLAAFKRALDDGLDGIEFDVQKSRDGYLVLIHDSTVEGRPVASLRFDELQGTDEAVTTLDHLMGLAKEYPGTLLNLEIKAPTVKTHGLERDVVKMIRGYGLEDRILVSSFNPIALARVRLAAPWLRTALLYKPGAPLILRNGSLAGWLHVDAIHPHYTLLSEPLLQKARRRGLAVNTWTVNDEAEVKRLKQLGADGIMGDDPSRLRRAAEGG